MTPATHELLVAAAVQRCLDAYHRTLAIPRKPDGTGSVHDYACEAYRNAMPFLSSPVNIDAFIACVAHAMLIGAIDPDDASKLLYAAQVAIASRRLQQKPTQSNSHLEPHPATEPVAPPTNRANSAAGDTPTPLPPQLMPEPHPEPHPEPDQQPNPTLPPTPSHGSAPSNQPTLPPESGETTPPPTHPAGSAAQNPATPPPPTPIPALQTAPQSAPPRPADVQQHPHQPWKPSHWRPVEKKTA